jgi:hypothetical protein
LPAITTTSKTRSSDVDTASRELDGDAPRAAARVEDGRRREAHDEGRLAVHVDPFGGQAVELLLVRVTFPRHRSNR